MSTQLRTALDTPSPEDTAKMHRVLTDAADLADLNSDPHAQLHPGAVDRSGRPAGTNRSDLVAATAETDPAADIVTRDLRSIGAPPAYALARELWAATRPGPEPRGSAPPGAARRRSSTCPRRLPVRTTARMACAARASRTSLAWTPPHSSAKTPNIRHK